MSIPVLEQDRTYTGSGTVLFSKGTGWIRPTGVFVPSDGFTTHHDAMTVLLWFHGWWVKDVQALFYQEATKLLPAVIASKRRVILVAPHLGWHAEGHSDYNAGVLGGGKKTE